jgi:hypothetical protein
MTALITLDDIRTYAEISSNVDVLNKLKPYIHQAQLFDLKPAIGDAFYFDLIANNDSTIYQDLINGKTYTDLQGNSIEFEGLKPALVYWAYARYKENSGVADTAYGTMIKRNDFSDPASEKTLSRIVTSARSLAVGYLNDAVKYLNVSGVSVYPLWRSDFCSSPNKAAGEVKISAVGDGGIYENYNGRFNPPYNPYW